MKKEILLPALHGNVEAAMAEVVLMGLFRSTRFVSDKLVVRVTRQMYGVAAGTGRKVSARDTRAGFIVTIGAPNYLERRFIKKMKNAGGANILNQPVPKPRARVARKVKPRAPR